MAELRQEFPIEQQLRKDIQDAQELRQLLKRQQSGNSASPSRNIYVVERLAPDIIDVLGSHFHIEPSIFMKHERTSVWDRHPDGVNQVQALPSTLKSNKSFLIKLPRTPVFGKGH